MTTGAFNGWVAWTRGQEPEPGPWRPVAAFVELAAANRFSGAEARRVSQRGGWVITRGPAPWGATYDRVRDIPGLWDGAK